MAKSNDELYAEHIRSWASVWAAGRIDVVGNIVLAQYIYGAFYYIISSMPLSEDATSPFIGLSPSGLPFGEFKKVNQLLEFRLLTKYGWELIFLTSLCFRNGSTDFLSKVLAEVQNPESIIRFLKQPKCLSQSIIS